MPESTGLFELLMLMALCRETGDSAARWLQRLSIGKTLVEKMDVKLPEKLYIDLATRFFIPSELKAMAKDLIHESKTGKITPAQAKNAISKLSSFLGRVGPPGKIEFACRRASLSKIHAQAFM